MDWTYSDTGLDVPTDYCEVHASVWQQLGACGTWWSGPDRVAIMAEVRSAHGCGLCRDRKQALTPYAVDGAHSSTNGLSSSAVEAVHRITTDPGRLTRSWAETIIEDIGEEPYVELVAVVCAQFAVDGFAEALGTDVAALPSPGSGAPSRIRPADVGDVGAWVAQSLDKTMANVTRAVSLVPDASAAWREVSGFHYSRGSEFLDLVWDRALTRPQVEVVASTVSSVNECFY